MIETVQLPYGLKDGKLIHVDEVPNGRACGCVCPACRAPLEARNAGKIKQSYFAHYKAEECHHAVETALHMMAKQILQESKIVLLPEYDKTPEVFDVRQKPYTGTRVYRPSSTLSMDQVDLEKGETGFRADAVGKWGDKLIYIEIKVTHAVDYKKMRLVKDRKYFMIEIDLSKLSGESILDKNLLTYAVTQEPKNRKWISQPEADEEYHRIIKALRQQVKPINDEVLQQQKKENARRQSVESTKEKFRKPYLEDLEKLEQTHDSHWQTMRAIELETASHQILPGLLAQLGLREIPKYLNVPVKSEWIFNAYRTVWQSGAFLRFIFQKPKQTIIKANDVKRWVVQQYGLLDVIERLNKVKQEVKQQGKERGKWYGQEGAWFFTSHENESIKSPYEPIIKFLKALTYRGILSKGTCEDEFLIALNTPQEIVEYGKKELSDFVERQKQMEIQADKAWNLHQENAQKYRENMKSLSAARIELLIASEHRVVRLYNRNARRCLNCIFTSHEEDGDCCPFCGNTKFESYELSDAHLKSAPHKYRSSAKVNASIERLPDLDVSLLK